MQPTDRQTTRVVLIVLAVVILSLAGVGLIWARRSQALVAPSTAPATTPAAAAVQGKWALSTDTSGNVVGTYSTSFLGSVPTEFSRGTIQFTKSDQRPYLGRFDQSGVQFAVNKMPRHQFVHVVFDLALLRSWNGSSRIWGPDVFTAQVAGGPQLLNATFCNCGFFDNNNEQSYPDTFPTPPDAVPHAGWTGAAELQTLGESQRFSNANPKVVEDTSSVYHMDWTFPHDGDALAIDFTTKVKNKSLRFGFLNFKVEVLGKPAELMPEDLESAWDDLAGDDPVAADKAVWQLTATPQQALGLLRAHLAATTTPISPYGKSRVFRVLQVIHSPEALQLSAALESARK